LAAGAYAPESAGTLRDAGLRVMIWTVNDPREARRVGELGAFALCTDDPERIMAAPGSI
jgi:glycerophosphoryl diester phosphodiesterase